METNNRRLARLALAALVAVAGACDDTGTDPNAPGVLEVALSARQAPADGATVVLVTGTVDRDTRGDARKLTFATGIGTFVESGEKTATVTADGAGVARVGLRAPTTAGVARIRVGTGSVERMDSVLFVRALPEQVLVEPEKFALAAGVRNELRITALLRRATGTPTPGTVVTFQAFRADTQEALGEFGVATLGDASGQVSVRYTAGNTDYRGRVRVVATTSGSGGPVIGEAVVEITD